MSFRNFEMLMKFFLVAVRFECVFGFANSKTWNSAKSRLLAVKIMLSTFSIRSAAKYNPWSRQIKKKKRAPQHLISDGAVCICILWKCTATLAKLRQHMQFLFSIYHSHCECWFVGTSFVTHKKWFFFFSENQSIVINHGNSSMEKCVGNQLIWSA